MKHLAELNPPCRLSKDDPPPKNTKVLLVTKTGVAVIGVFSCVEDYPAWAPLPKLTEEQKCILGM